jgi:hypothetical protein
MVGQLPLPSPIGRDGSTTRPLDAPGARLD